jgi:UDP-GlcNAc3NAcA epimerase
MAVHPRTRKLLSQGTQALQGVRLVDPLGYLDMTQLMHHACAAYTDSGGLQKEAYFHQVPCVTLRDETEWVETIEAGWNRLWTQPDYRPRHPITEYGTGDASRKIAQVLRDRLDRTPS